MNRSSAFSHLEVIFSFHSERALQIPIDECIRTSYMRGSRIFFRGGGEVQARKQYGQRFFQVLNLFYSLQGGGGSNGFSTEKTILFKGSEPVRPLPPAPLDPHMSNLSDLMYAHNIKYCPVYFSVAFSRVLIIMTQNETAL